YTAAGTYTPSITIANSLGSLQPTLNTRVTVASNPPTFINFSPDQIIAPENVGSLTFTLARSGNLSVRSTVHWSHVETATGPVNQAEATGGDVTFAPGETTKTFSLRVYDDGVYNGYSARDWVVASATDGTMSGSSNFPSAAAFGQYLLTEVNAQPTASVADVRVLESAGTADFVITMSAPVAFAASFTATLADGTAKAGSDYTAASQQWCTITPGDTRCVIRIPIIDDSVPEPDKTFTLTIDSPNGAFGPAIVRSTATCTIVDDDAAPLAVTRIDPAYAPASGGSSVTLFGDGLDARCSVAFGSVPAAAIAPVSGGVSVVVPPHAPGAVDVTVVCGSARAVLPRAFTFFVPRRRAAG
ncbi:MAG TPA: Calx-beta domain-containing protein, partial [Thermoanaerobaculia bacterium]|nr:Calx-beta domain-containing protein [Thermoanaerobaculia bacterium]